jgi:pectate lyase
MNKGSIMKTARLPKLIISSVVLVFCLTDVLYSQQLAFPTAEGYGKYALGGRGGSVYEVTTLNPSGPGSLGEAIGTSGPRTVVFRVSGIIEGKFNIKNDRITIAGQTAPGDGICIRGSLGVSANDVIIRYVRVRANPKVETDAIGGRYKKNIILDHVSASWSSDEVLSIYHCENVTIQYCMITEACAKGDSGHRFGGIWGSNYATYHHNLIAHNDSRNPRWASGCGFNDYRNNVLYNWG